MLYKFIVVIAITSIASCGKANSPIGPSPDMEVSKIENVTFLLESNSTVPLECTNNQGFSNPACPTIIVYGVTPSLDYTMYGCFSSLASSADTIIVNGNCVGRSSSSNKDPKVFQPSMPKDGVRYAITFILHDPSRQGLFPYRSVTDGIFRVPLAVAISPMVIPYVIFLAS